MEQPTHAVPGSNKPAECIHALSADDRARFQLLVYRSTDEAWRFAEQHETALFISDDRIGHGVLCGWVSGLTLLSPDFVHIHVHERLDTATLSTIVNRAGVVRLINRHQLHDKLGGLCADALMAYLRNRRKDNEMARLREQNEQFEFMLRQSLLS